MSIQSLSDNQLVVLYLGGNEKGLEILLHRHKSKLFASIIHVVKDRALSEDIFQDTFFKAIQTLKKGQYNEEGKFLPWIFRISRNLIIDHYRRIKKMPPANVFYNEEGEEIHPLDLVPEKNESFHQTEENKNRRKDVRQLIQLLPPDQREVVIMRTYYDMSFKEIADITNVSINTSLGRMRYALINLKKMMEERKMQTTF